MMNDTKHNSHRAFAITATLTLIVAGFEILLAYAHYKPGMNFLDIASYVTANRLFYCLILIVCNLALISGAILLYKENGIKLKDEIFDRNTIKKDIFYGLIALGVTEILGILFSFTAMGRTELAFQGGQTTIETMVMEFLALTVVSGFCKEIFFRGLARRFCGPVMGEMTALMLFNLMFAVLDWHNLGYSFVVGLVWIWSYKKTGHLLAPMIAHGGANFIGIFYNLIVNGGI